MARLKTPDQLEALRRQHIALAIKIKEAEAKARDKAKEQDQRRSEIAGRLALAHAAENPESEFAVTLAAVLHKGLTRATERALFPGLPAPAVEDETPAGDALPAAQDAEKTD